MKPFWFVTTKHKDVTERLEKTNHALYMEVKKVLDLNKSERHIRGGIATREKFRHQRNGTGYASFEK